MSSFTEKNKQETTENTDNNSTVGGIFGKALPFVPLLLEEFTGQKLKMSGTIGELQASQQRLEINFNEFAKATAEQFIFQAQQLNSLLALAQSLQDFRLGGGDIKFIKN
ncbi:MAG: hypothetical protein GBAus27B_000308 [Mycoplasmataceae bacterium]|nr:MAG: hypothetical protein GBAus27B_000308 [Mycoplasmataceae bacterium]